MASFIRKNNNPDGIYNAAYRVGTNPDTGLPEIKQTIVIEGRTIFQTDDKKMIEFLRNDPEILEYDKKTKLEIEEE